MIPIQLIVSPERLTELTALLDKALADFKGTPLEKQYEEQRKLFLDPDVPDYEYVSVFLFQVEPRNSSTLQD